MHSKDHGVSRGAGAHSSALARLGHLVLASTAFELFYNLSCGERVMQNGFLLTDVNVNYEVRDSPPQLTSSFQHSQPIACLFFTPPSEPTVAPHQSPHPGNEFSGTPATCPLHVCVRHIILSLVNTLLRCGHRFLAVLCRDP